MTISSGNLDSLLGMSLPGTALTSLAVQSTTLSQAAIILNETIASVTANPTSDFFQSTDSFKVSSVNDAENTITVSLYSNGENLGSTTYYVIGQNSTSLLLSGINEKGLFDLALESDYAEMNEIVYALSLNNVDLGNSPVGTAITWTALSAPTESVSAALTAYKNQTVTAETAVAIADTASAVQANIDALESMESAISGITLTDSSTPTLSLSVSQYSADTLVLDLIDSPYHLALTGSTAQGASSAANSPGVTAVAVTDSAYDVVAYLDTLQGLAAAGKLTGITLTDSGIPTLSLNTTQISNDQTALDDISGTFTVSVTASGNQTIVGLAGHATTIVIAGNASQYVATTSGNGTSFTLTGDGSTLHLSNVSALQFSDQTDFVAATPGSGQVTTGNITELYSAVLAREPDVAGLAFYQTYLKSNPNTPLLQFAEWFLSSQEYTSNSAHNYAQTSAGDAQFITDSYENLLHRTPSAAEIAYYQSNVMAPALAGLTAGTQAYSNAEFQAHAQMLVYFSASPEFLSDVQVTAAHPSDAQHWLVLI